MTTTGTTSPSETIDRPVGANYDRKGNPAWKSETSPPDSTNAKLSMVPDRIIPVIFVPGVMGSNLKGTSDPKVKWRLDTDMTAGAWALAKYDAKFRKGHLTPANMQVDDAGALPSGTQQSAEELKRRGWGEVGAISYGPFLPWLENALNDYDNPKDGLREKLIGEALGALKGEEALIKDAVALSYRYRFPVHACGYNWLDSNAASAQLLKERIESIVDRYKAEKKMCEKVILVTHSMGGMVARHCSEVLKMSSQILGIVHGVMPTIGAAAVYRRMKAGTESVGDGFMGSLKGSGTASALGNDAGEMTAVLSGAPGPLQLLPTPEYGNGWLCVKDSASEVRLPRNGDPYGEIYTERDKWWGLCEDHLINPLNEESDPKKKRAVMEADWETFTTIIKEVKVFHKEIASRYHPNTHLFFGSDSKFKSFGVLTWQQMGARRAPTDLLSGTRDNPGDTGVFRTVKAPLTSQPKVLMQRNYMLGPQDEDGDGTVPRRSGIAPKDAPQVKSVMQVSVGHEPAFKNSEAAKRFTLRAIVQIAQGVSATSLRYD